MPTNYNATITTHHLTETDIDHYIEALNTYHVAVSNPRAKEGQIILTIPANTLTQAIQTTQAIATSAGITIDALTIETTERFDTLANEIPMPKLISVTEAAQLLKVSRQAILQRITAHTIPATKIGDTWAIPRAAIKKC